MNNPFLKRFTKNKPTVDTLKAKPACLSVVVFMLQNSEALLNKLLFRNALQVDQSEAETGMTVSFVQFHFPRCDYTPIIDEEEEEESGRSFIKISVKHIHGSSEIVPLCYT